MKATIGPPAMGALAAMDETARDDRATIGATGETFCYGHPKTPTKLRCTRCDRPICGRCAIPASVGQHCPECVAEARRSAPKVRTVMAKTAPVAMTLLAINGIVFAGQMLVPGLTNALVMDPVQIAGQGEWWRLLTSIVLHSPTQFFHILFNSLVLWIYGPQLEGALGHVRFGIVYLVAGFAANAASYAFGNCASSLGASGAIFGIVGALLVFLYRRRSSQAAAQILSGMLVFVGFNLLLGFAVRGIDNFAHLGGLVSGAALGLGLDTGSSRTPPLAAQLLTAIIVGGAAMALILWRTANFSCGGATFF
ncbi:MAG TPA: rhomboid family intramembrane serine protease [Actinomycetota bacterium]|nr:rhomboid family intramembrane serine protease [Actinomycetota bacterium]